MSDPKYNKYAGTVRFDDDNIVDIDLQPDTENIRVLLNGSAAGNVMQTYYVAQAESAPADAPALPEGYEWSVNNSYVLVDPTTQSVLSLAQVMALNLGEFYVIDNIHIPDGGELTCIPLTLGVFNGFDPENPTEGVIACTFTCITGEGSYLTVGWELTVSESEG